MSVFEAYLSLGFWHITDLAAYDHILFIVALCAIYQLKDWKRILILVTAFTIGHSATLALASLDVIVFSGRWVEILIPITILLTCLFNVITNFDLKSAHRQKYFLALSFGLIHGMGFSSYLKSAFKNASDVIFPLFSFNVGIELGQLIIVLIILGLGYVAMNVLKVKQQYWNWTVSGLAFVIAIKLLVNLLMIN